MNKCWKLEFAVVSGDKKIKINKNQKDERKYWLKSTMTDNASSMNKQIKDAINECKEIKKQSKR